MPPPVTYVLTVDSTDPASGVAITVAPADNNSAANGTTSFTRTYNSGTSVTLIAPSTSGGNDFSTWSGCTSVSTVTCTELMSANATVTANYEAPALILPTVTVTPASSNTTTAQPLTVTVGVSGGVNNPTPTGSVTLTSGSYTSAATMLVSGSAQITIPAGSLATGSNTLSATYTPDSASSSIYRTSTGTSSAVTVTQQTAVTVDQSSCGPAVTDQLLGMNMAIWNDTTLCGILPAFQTAGIKAVRWPGGSDSDIYHWATELRCAMAAMARSDFHVCGFRQRHGDSSGLDMALTANYGSNAACTGGGDPTEAAAWAAAAVTDGANVSHMTVGNEVYGSWEYDLHTKPNDPTTYAAAVVEQPAWLTTTIKAADSSVLVGVVVDADNSTGGCGQHCAPMPRARSTTLWSITTIRRLRAKENDTSLVHQLAQGLTTNINTVKAELSEMGHSRHAHLRGRDGLGLHQPRQAVHIHHPGVVCRSRRWAR